MGESKGAGARLKSAVEKIERCVSSSVVISETAMGVNHTGRQIRALMVFAKLTVHSMAVSALLDKYHHAPKGSKLLDHFSIGVLGRTIIDASLMAMYISKIDINKDEWDLRRQVLFRHDMTNRKRFLISLQKVSGRKDEEFMRSYDVVKAGIVEKIERLASGQGYSRAKIDEFVSGKLVYINGARDAAREADWDVDQFEFQQTYLSNWVHSHPVSFLRADEHKISFTEPSDYQKDFVSLVLETCSGYLTDVNSRMSAFTGDISKDPIGQLD